MSSCTGVKDKWYMILKGNSDKNDKSFVQYCFLELGHTKSGPNPRIIPQTKVERRQQNLKRILEPEVIKFSFGKYCIKYY